MYICIKRVQLRLSLFFVQEKIESIHKAVQEGNLKSLETLLNRKKYAVAKEKATGASVLHKAIIYGHTDIIK